MKKYVPMIAFFVVIIIAVCAVFGVNSYRKNTYKRDYSEFVEKYSSEYSVPESLVYAVIKTESGFDKDAVSKAGNIGLMQLGDDTYTWISRVMGEEAPTGPIDDPETNIKYGTYYLHNLYKRFGDWDTALAGYNAGHGRVASWLDDKLYSTDGKTLTYIPIDETRNYVNKVNRAKEIYEKLYYEGEQQ